MCVFCQEFNEGSTRIIWEDDDWVVIPGLGSFVPGYCLLLPRLCYPSFSSILPRDLRRAEEGVAEAVRMAIAQQFGHVVIAEHGIGKRFNDNGSACCNDHAHLHFFPIPEPEKMIHCYQVAGGRRPFNLGAFAELISFEHAYLFLSPSPGLRLAWNWKQEFGKQFARRIAASLVGKGDKWDWRKFHFEENMQITLQKLRRIPKPWVSNPYALLD